MAASCQPMERNPAIHCPSGPHPRILDQALARLVGGYPGCPLPALDLVQSIDISGTGIVRSLDFKGHAWETGLAEPGCCAVAGYHSTEPNILSAISGIGMLFVFWGVLIFDVWPTVFGMVIVTHEKFGSLTGWSGFGRT
jgi:hypothetical protein